VTYISQNTENGNILKTLDSQPLSPDICLITWFYNSRRQCSKTQQPHIQ